MAVVLSNILVTLPLQAELLHRLCYNSFVLFVVMSTAASAGLDKSPQVWYTVVEDETRGEALNEKDIRKSYIRKIH